MSNKNNISQINTSNPHTDAGPSHYSPTDSSHSHHKTLRCKVLSVFGTRPEAIKMAPVIQKLEESQNHQSIVCVTGQHRDMLDQMLDLFNIKVNYDLNIMTKNQHLGAITSKVMLALEKVIQKEQPDWLLVQGDTTSCFSAALTAFYNRVKVGHIEAGLRTNNLASPFPEEANRQLVSRIAGLHFAPTKTSQDNLIKEGINKNTIVVTGNTVIDALLWVKNKVLWQSNWAKQFGTATDVIQENKNIILVTGHRRENHGAGFINICEALKTLALKFKDWHFIYPVHLNPNVSQPVFERLSNIDNIHLTPPLDYQPFVYLLKCCYMVLTDSGGIQEEAPALGKPVLVMRYTTERPEGIAAGTAKLVGTDSANITKNVTRLIENKQYYANMAKAINPYGNGKASKLIVDWLK